VVEENRVLDRRRARLRRLHDRPSGLRVTRDGATLVLRLLDDRAQLLERHRVTVGRADRAEPRPARLDLDPVDAVLDLLTDGVARFPRAGDDLGQRRRVLLAAEDVRGVEVAEPAPDRDDLLRGLDPRTRQTPGGNGVPDDDGDVAARAHVANRR